MNAITECYSKSRFLVFPINKGYAPPEVRAIFGFFEPSQQHVKRFCKILRAEMCQQIRFLRVCLKVACASDQKVYAPHWKTAAQLSDILWKAYLPWVPKMKKICEPVNKMSMDGANSVKLLRAEPPLKFVSSLLQQGPKYCLPAQLKKPELLAVVRKVP